MQKETYLKLIQEFYLLSLLNLKIKIQSSVLKTKENCVFSIEIAFNCFKKLNCGKESNFSVKSEGLLRGQPILYTE